MVAIFFLAQMSFRAAERFGEWGERSIVESTLIVTQEKIERAEEIIRTTDDTFFRIVDPAHLDMACERWLRAISSNRLVVAGVILDDFGDIVSYFYRDPDEESAAAQKNLIEREIAPLIDKYESLDQYKHLHRLIQEDYRLISHYTTVFQGEDYTACLLYDTKELVDGLLAGLLENVGSDRVANVVNDRNDIILGRSVDQAGQYVVVKRFPSTLYKWRLQLAPTAAALFSSDAQKKAKRISQVMLVPLALGVIILGLVVLALSAVRERRLNRLKSDFIANVSHELKTPLSLIRMFSELLVMGKARDEQKAQRYSAVILRESERLSSLIDNVLNLARIERGKKAYERREMDVAIAVDHAVEIYRPHLEAKEVQLEYRVADNIPPAKIDDHAIILAVVNLLDNAVKYAAGTDVVGVSVSAHRGMVHLDVFDHGAGIPQNQLKRIFERFYRVPTLETRQQRGSGIGLSLVKHIAEAHGGRIEVSSQPGVETRFSLRIPSVDVEGDVRLQA